MNTPIPMLLPASSVTRPTTFLSRAVALVRDRGTRRKEVRKAPIWGEPLTQYEYDAQGHFVRSLGSCVGCAGTNFLNATPFPANKDQAWANALWEWCRLHDGDRGNNDLAKGDEGTYPGTLVKRLKMLGLVEDESRSFDTEKDAAEWSVSGPAHLPARILLFGVRWQEGMNHPDPDGRLRTKGAAYGGHEFPAFFNAARNRWEGFQSWKGYGPFDVINQVFYIVRKDMRHLFSWGASAKGLVKKP